MNPLNHVTSVRQLTVGADRSDVSPRGPIFLYGYPRAPRISTGMHDPLLASAMFLHDGSNGVIFVSVDTIWLSKSLVAAARAQIAEATGLPESHLMISATHTHSGPSTVQILSNADDAVVPPPDPAYLSLLSTGIVRAAVGAYRQAEPAEIAVTSADCVGIGTNRLDPSGPTITEIPVLAARSASDKARYLGLLYINPTHPTILQEDSTLVSADFPGMCRIYLQRHLVGRDCPVLCHLGAAGNQSPRYVVRSHTICEAERIGDQLGSTIKDVVRAALFTANVSVSCATTAIDLPPRPLSLPAEAAEGLQLARNRLAELRRREAEYGTVRTAQCAVFGAEETVCLARAAAQGKLHSVQESCLPAEVQLIRIGDWSFIGWPGEVFVEFALQVRERHSNAWVITLANGELQGYLVTADAVRRNCYEAMNAIFASPAAGEMLVGAAFSLLAEARAQSGATSCIA